jgi:hypothetical protein
MEKSTKKNDLPVYERSWEWMKDDDRANIVRKRKSRDK